MRATRLSCITKHFAPFYLDPQSRRDLPPYREVTYQSEDMPQFLVGKPMDTVDEVKASIAQRPRLENDDYYWDEPDDEEREAVPGVLYVMRYVDLRNASDAFPARLAAAAGGPRSLPVRMAAKNNSGLLAWIETEHDIDKVLVARDGQIHLTRLLGGVNSLDWGYEGCHARLLRWYGDRLVIVSFERNTYIRSIDPLSGEETGFWLNGSWLIDDDLLLYLTSERGLLQTVALPSLRPVLPIPFCQPSNVANREIQLKRLPVAPGAKKSDLPEGKVGIFCSRGGGYFLETLKLPSPSQRAATSESDVLPTDKLLDVIDSNLFPDRRAPWPARLALEALSYPFLQEALSEKAWRPSPVWLPVYWHHHLLSTGREHEARELLSWLDHIAAPLHPEALSVGWRPEWNFQLAYISLAILHVRRTCRFVAEAVRARKLPEGTTCLLFDPKPGTQVRGSRVDPARFPPVLRQAFEELRLSESATLRLPCK